MSDHRVHRLAKLLVHHCISVQHNDRVLIKSPSLAEPLVMFLTEEVLRAGGHPHLLVYPDRYAEVYEQYAQEHQLSFTPTFELLAYQQFEGLVSVFAAANTRSFSRIDPSRDSLWNSAWEPIFKSLFEREAKGEFRRVATMYPTHAYAQETRMSLRQFEDLVYRACHVDHDQQDAVAFWQGMTAENEARIRALSGHKMVHLRSSDCDLKFSLEGRVFVSAAGKVNMPDGEIFTGPVEDSANGWIRFTYPSLYLETEVAGVELVFDDGVVTEARATIGESVLKARLAQDKGASRLGEFGIGTNYGITEPTGMLLLDEKLGGSIHLALGLGYPETGNNNKSGIHWDLITDFSENGEIAFDGEVLYKNGRFIA